MTEQIIQILKGFRETGEPEFVEVSVIACAGYRDIDPNHIKVHLDPKTGPKKRRKKTDPQQTLLSLE